MTMFCPFCAVGLSRVGAICPACQTALPDKSLLHAYESALAADPKLANPRNRAKLDAFVTEHGDISPLLPEPPASSLGDELAAKSQSLNYLMVLLFILACGLGFYALHEHSVASHRYDQIASARALQNSAEKRAQTLQDQISQQVRASQSAEAHAAKVKADLALVHELLTGSNRAAAISAQAQFEYDIAHSYPGFLNKSLALACAKGLAPAGAESYTQLVAPVSTSTIKITDSSFTRVKAAPLPGLVAADVAGFAGKTPQGTYYSVQAVQTDFQGGAFASSQKYVMHIAVLNGKAYSFTSWC